MNFFLDANISPRIANMVAGFCADDHEIVHITQHGDLSHHHVRNTAGKVIGNRTPDREWISSLSASDRDWKVISGDMNIIDKAHERAILLESRLTFFVFDRSWGKLPAAEQAWKLMKLWEEIVVHARRPGPALYRIHAGKRLYVELIKAGTRARGGGFRG